MVSHHISVFFYLKINNDIMNLYSKWFDTHNEYEAYKNGQNYILPNVSICHNNLHVHYEKKYDPYNGHEYVDLGLPSGTLWAKCNVGAESETDYGQYFAWGETQGYTAEQVGTDKTFTWNDYKYGIFDEEDPDLRMTKYNSTDGKTTLDITDDAARVNMGGEWHMPTQEQIYELINNIHTSHSLITKDGVYGMLFTSKYNSNTLFFPFTGYVDRTLVLFNQETFIWISEKPSNPNFALDLEVGDDDEEIVGVNDRIIRCLGNIIRGVIG